MELPSYLTDAHTPVHLSMAMCDAMQGSAQRELAHLLPEGRGTAVEVAHQVALGVPHQKILETAVAEQVDWIVMATHGRTGLSHLLMGSVAERVVRTAPCPVPTIRPAVGKA